MPEQSYEFTDVQNQILKDLSKKMKGVAVFLFILGGLVAFQGIQALVYGGNYLVSIATAVLYILMGIWTLRAGIAFSEVVRTEGSDIGHLMRAITSLLSLFTLQMWLFIIAVALTVVVVLFLAVNSGTQLPIS